MTPPAETDAASVITAAQTVKAMAITMTGRTLSRLGLDLSPEKGLHQTIISLADQAVASCHKLSDRHHHRARVLQGELGLYMLASA